MHRNVETLIGRLATDSSLRRRFVEDPTELLRDAVRQGFELTPIELEALGSIDANALRMFAAAVDRRLQKAPLTVGRPDPDVRHQPVTTEIKEENS